MNDDTTDATGVERASGNSWQTASKVDVDIDLRVQGVAQDAFFARRSEYARDQPAGE